MVVVAHRLSTVENATRIIVIDKGVVVEQGTKQHFVCLCLQAYLEKEKHTYVLQ